MPFLTEPTESECFEAEQELLFDVRFRQLDREIRKMIEQDKQKDAKNTEQLLQPNSHTHKQRNNIICLMLHIASVAVKKRLKTAKDAITQIARNITS